MLVLRDYQASALERTRQRFREGKRAPLLVAPTGSGKTVMLAAAAIGHFNRAGQVVILVHRDELIHQTIDKLEGVGLTGRIGAVSARYGFNMDAPVVVCGIQTLLAREYRPKASLLIADEAHHYLSRKWNELVQHYRGVPALGFTATPIRADGTALGGMFDCLEVVATNAELVKAGHLVPIDVIGPPRRLSDADILDPVRAYQRYSPPGRAVFFAASRPHGLALAERLGPLTGYVDGDTPAEERRVTLARFAVGDLIRLVNVFVLTEGWDCPPANICVIARGCSSPGTYIQMVGRVRRPHPGKERALLIDCKGATWEHGLPDAERVFSLDGIPIRQAAPASLRQCPQCGMVFETARTCDRCGYVFAVDRRPIREIAAELRPVDKVTPEDTKREFLSTQLARARAEKKKPGWAAYRFRWRFGHWPPPAWMKEARV